MASDAAGVLTSVIPIAATAGVVGATSDTFLNTDVLGTKSRKRKRTQAKDKGIAVSKVVNSDQQVSKLVNKAESLDSFDTQVEQLSGGKVKVTARFPTATWAKQFRAFAKRV